MNFRHLLLLAFSALLLMGCSDDTNSISFYHWKSNAQLNGTEVNALEQAQAETVYLHYFDVDAAKPQSYGDPGVYPVGVLKEVGPELKSRSIVPVVFIANRVFEREVEAAKLAEQIKTLVNEMSTEHFGQPLPALQVDCDWTASTRTAYFEVLELLKPDFELSTTIRLHQLKYPDDTGIPPVDRGALMVYNIGSLSNFEQNSIINTATVRDYINSNTSYPMELDVALPLFSQLVIRNNRGQHRLLAGLHRQSLQAATTHFEASGPHTFTVLRDTLCHGYFLYKGYELKVEEVNLDSAMAARAVVHASDLHLKSTIFYHLDSASVHSANFSHLQHPL